MEFLSTLASDHPNLVTVTDLRDPEVTNDNNDGITHEGRRIPLVKISRSEDKDRRAVWVDAGKL